MAVDAAALAAMAMGAARKPSWKRPDPTALGPVIATQSQESQYHPTLDLVQNKLAALDASARNTVLTTRLGWVLERRESAETALGVIGVPTTLPTTLAPARVSPQQWPLASERRVIDLPLRLLAGEKSRHGAETFDTDQALAALDDDTIIATASAQAASAAALLLQMRCLSDIYARWEVGARLTASLAASQLADPPLSNRQLLARILTYARIEGDSSIPPEDDTLEASDPGSDGNQIPLPPGRTRLAYVLTPTLTPYCYCVTVLALPVDKNGAQLSDASKRLSFADEVFTVVLGGMDILWNPAYQTNAEAMDLTAAAPFAPTDLLDWCALNRQIPATVTHDAARQSAQDDLTSRIGLLVETMKGPPAGQASRIAARPASNYDGDYSGASAQYASLVLSEGARYMNRLTYGPTRFGAGSATQLPEILVYLLFHQGGSSAALLTSAASTALRASSGSSYAKALATALNGAGLTSTLHSTLDSIRKDPNSDRAIQSALGSWSTIGPLLGSPGVIPALADYVRHESDASWKGWALPRSNCIGHALLYEYLLAQTGS